MAATTRVTSAMVAKITLKSNERTRTKRSRITMAMRRCVRITLIALSPRTRKVVHHVLHCTETGTASPSMTPCPDSAYSEPKGAMDGLGLRTFVDASFENTLAHVIPV